MPNSETIGQPIQNLQTMLRTISQYDKTVLPVIPDGIYGKDTMASVSSFQKRAGLPVTGVADLNTWYKMVETYRRAVVEIGPAEPVNPLLEAAQSIHPGDANNNLYLMHGMLLAIAAFYPSLPKPACNNLHDEASVAAIKWLQERAGIEPTGEITRITWSNLARLYRITVGDGAVTAPAAAAVPESGIPDAVG